MFAAPANWRDTIDWYLNVPENDRKAFAEKYCTSVYSCDGQSVVIISYPRSDGTVVLYDMDGGRFIKLPLSDCEVGKGFEEVYRESEQPDFEWSMIMDSMFSEEADDICGILYYDH